MTMLDTVLMRPEAAALGWTLVHFTWQGALIAAALGIALFVLRGASPQVRYATSAAAMLLLVAAPVVTFVIALLDARVLVPEVAMAGMAIEPDAWSLRARLAAWLPQLTTAWFAGMCLFQFRLLVNWMRAQDLRRRGVAPASAAWCDEAAGLAARLGVRRPVTLVASALAPTAAVVGWLRPAIVIPASAFSGLSPEQLRAIIAHELAHVRRHDYLVNVLQSVAEAVFFYHPAVWWISHRLRVEREFCCDDLALGVCGDARDYARALCALEELRDADLTPAVAYTGGSLMQRIARLIGAPTRTGRGTAAWIVPSVAALAVTVMSIGLSGAAADVLHERHEHAKPHDHGEGHVLLEVIAEDGDEPAEHQVLLARVHEPTGLAGVDLEAVVRDVNAEEADLVAVLRDAGFENEEVVRLMRALGVEPTVLEAIDMAAVHQRARAHMHGLEAKLKAAVEAGRITRAEADAKLEMAHAELRERLHQGSLRRVDPNTPVEVLLEQRFDHMRTDLHRARAEVEMMREVLAKQAADGTLDPEAAAKKSRMMEQKTLELAVALEKMEAHRAKAMAEVAALRADGLSNDEIRKMVHAMELLMVERKPHPRGRKLPGAEGEWRERQVMDEAAMHELEARVAAAHKELIEALKNGTMTKEQAREHKQRIHEMIMEVREARHGHVHEHVHEH